MGAMTTVTRKQREIQQREARILEVARDLFITEGYHGLSMDRVAHVLEYAKGTIYNHFPCKEEILIALANLALQQRLQMFRQAATYPGGTRERLCAIGAANELFVKRFPDHFRVEQLIRSTSIWDKISAKRRDTLRHCESSCMETVCGVVRDGVAAGDVILPEGLTPEDFVFGLWSMGFGAYMIIATSPSLPEIGITDPFVAIRRNLNILVDGLGWRPLSHEHNFIDLFDEVQEQLFAAEIGLTSGA